MSFDDVRGQTVWAWPEFQAFAKRLGIPEELQTTDVVINIPCAGLVTVTQTYFGEDRTQVSEGELRERAERFNPKSSDSVSFDDCSKA